MRILLIFILALLEIYALIPKEVLCNFQNKKLIDVGIVGKAQFNLTKATKGPYDTHLGIGTD